MHIRVPGVLARTALGALIGACLFGPIVPPATAHEEHDVSGYRWVDPPASLEDGNHPPGSARDEIPVGAAGSAAQQVATGDGQVVLLFPPGAFPPGTPTPVRLVVRPLDARKPAPPPPGREFDGNAYEVKATAGGHAVEVVKPVTLLVRYARAADRLLVLDRGRWNPVGTQVLGGTLQLEVQADSLGTFAASGPIDKLGEFGPGWRTTLWVFALTGAGLALVLAGGWAIRRKVVALRR